MPWRHTHATCRRLPPPRSQTCACVTRRRRRHLGFKHPDGCGPPQKVTARVRAFVYAAGTHRVALPSTSAAWEAVAEAPAEGQAPSRGRTCRHRPLQHEYTRPCQEDIRTPVSCAQPEQSSALCSHTAGAIQTLCSGVRQLPVLTPRTSLRSVRPKFFMARATEPIFSPICGSTSTTAGCAARSGRACAVQAAAVESVEAQPCLPCSHIQRIFASKTCQHTAIWKRGPCAVEGGAACCARCRPAEPPA